MLGWLSAAMARASCSKRRRRSGISRERGGQDFYGDVAPQALVARAIDLSHAACADE
jgi:hypothetical protein